jgi:hypothetical protein
MEKIKIPMGLALAALGALTSFAFAQTPPRSDEAFPVWSSGDRAVFSRHDFARTSPTELMPGRDQPVAESLPPASRSGMLVDEPQGASVLHSCMKLAAPREVQQFGGHC